MTLFLELWVGNCWIDFFFPKCPEPWREMKIKNNEELVRQWEDSSVKLFLTDFFLSLISGYINIKCLSRNKLLHYTWYGYKSLVQTLEKPLGIQWIASNELHGRLGAMALAEGSGEVAPAMQLCCPQPGRPLNCWGDQGIYRCSCQVPLKNPGCPEQASVLLVFRACPGNLDREAESNVIRDYTLWLAYLER